METNKAKSKFVYPDKLYARCKDNKTLDMSYAPQNMEAVEYIRTDSLPSWKKSTLPNNNVTGINSDYLCYKGYIINYKELFDKLPKED